MVYVYLRSLFVYLAIDNVKLTFMGKTFCVETNRNICLVALAFFVYNLVIAVRWEREDCDDGDKGEFRNGFQHNNCEIMLQIEDEQEQDNTRFGQNLKAKYAS